ncbi:hypothetical protein ASZ78_014256 [Callipepla squamata]|uniref:Uncharacterized protein n=1 Tax=Callipepla squamata TaxID=9009 RepID=A0A226NN78_CALSU|nr:hypothetical protein ASZ78_014256 [Callipepla squamata]
MATFFGEVVVAPSRAGVDDEEETEETAEDREIRRELQEKRFCCASVAAMLLKISSSSGLKRYNCMTTY